MEAPETRYVAVGDAEVAYQVVGDGPIDLVYFYGLGSHIDMLWRAETRGLVPLLRRFSSLARVILLDRRGSGASGSLPRPTFPTWEEWTEDLAAVLDAAGAQRANILAESEVGPIAILFAALRPERVESLILANTGCRALKDDDYPFGFTPEAAEALAQWLQSTWGTPELLEAMYEPGDELVKDAQYMDGLCMMCRASATPRDAGAQIRYIMNSLDVRSALPMIQDRPPSSSTTRVTPYSQSSQGAVRRAHPRCSPSRIRLRCSHPPNLDQALRGDFCRGR